MRFHANGGLISTDLDLPLLQRGKVRDIYVAGGDRLLMVASDRLSAFDVVLPQPIPRKGEVLTRVSGFWKQRFASYIASDLTGEPLDMVIPDPDERHQLGDRAIIVNRFTPLLVEAIVRGHLIGSGWKDYQRTGAVCGIALPAGLQQAEQLPEPIFTPSTKAAIGAHDENIEFAQMVEILGDRNLAERVREVSLAIFVESVRYARERGIIIPDTKFEFGLDADGRLHLIDELLTPDSSRFWPADQYRVGTSPPSFDKQFVRDYLETLDWDKRPPGPKLPKEVVERTEAKYREAELRLTAA